MANNFAEALFGARDNARDRIRQQEMDAQANQMRQFQMQEAQTKSRGSQQEALYGLAKGYKDYLSQNPQGGQQYYERFLAPSLRGLGLGDPGPYNEQEAVSLADQVLSAYGGQQTGSSVQSTYVDNEGNRVAVMRDGSRQILGQNAPNNQIIDTGDGFVGVNKGNLRAAPVMLGGAATPIPQGGQFMGPDGIPVQMDPNMDPAVQQAIMANPSAWAGAPDGATATLPPQQGGQQLRSAPKAEASSALDDRLRVARELGATPEEQRRMVIGGDSGRDAQRISAKDATTARQKVTQIQTARNQLRSAMDAFNKLKGTFSAGLGGQYLPTPEGQAFDRAIANLAPLITAVTRVPGVGAMSDYETRLQQAALPSRGTYEDVTLQQFRDLGALLDSVEGGYTDLLSGGQADPNVSDDEDDIDSLLDQYR